MADDPKKPTVPETQYIAFNATTEVPPPSPPTWVDHIKAMLPKNWQQILSWLIVAILSGVLAKYGIPLVAPTDPLPLPVWEQQHIEEQLPPPSDAADKSGKLNMGVDWSKIRTKLACNCCRCDAGPCGCKPAK